MSTTIVTTDRLILRSAQASDFEPLFSTVFSDPVVMQYLSADQMGHDEAAQFFADAFDHEGTGRKIGILAERGSGAVIGYAGLKPCDALGEDDFEFGFVLQRAAWGKGYATEIGLAQLDYGFRTIDRPRMLAQVMPANAGSANALLKLGMVFVKEYERPQRGMWHVYCLERE
ncbi:GNAT family N-acetyltransferase [Undibacterium sp. TJN19]|uniref:GNAT family N-acetyltransferase n=1 Tax=Undibacterium sp. TJN19 TaxID=3413055 RepID=UPI003BF0E73B